MNYQKTNCLLAIVLLFMLMVFAEGVRAENEAPAVETDSALLTGKLNDIVNNIALQQKEIESRLPLLKKAKTEQEKNKIQAEIDEISRAIEEQTLSFEMILTAGQELAKETKEIEPFDWQKDLLEVLEPVLSELRQMTEDRRKQDNLKKRIAFYQNQDKEIGEVLKHIAKFDKSILEPVALEQFEQIEKKWRDEFQENNHLLEIVQFQLNEMVRSQEAREIPFQEHVRQFVVGRGATLMMALGAFAGIYLLLIGFWKLMARIIIRKNVRWTYYQRLTALIYHSFTIMLAIAAMFYVFSVRNDQVLLAVTVLLLVSIIWVLKNSLPRYINELKLLLNTGAVREGECINYQGITMKIDRLQYYARLVNPVLPDLKLRVPLSELINYVSRPCAEDEPWFPCRVGDYVMLNDDRYGRVKCITLDSVQLSLSDGAMPQTYAVSDFLSASPKNLSEGFLITSVIGIDYQYQPQSTTAIPKLFQEGIRERLLQEPYGQSLKGIWVNFELANASSLDYKIIVTFEGSAAGDYYTIKRDLQRFAVDVCNQQQWNIPFSQLVIHQGTTAS